MECRSSWTREEIRQIYDTPLLELIYQAASVHRRYHLLSQVQACALISVKTGGCSEDCKYCPQSVRYQTHVGSATFMKKEEVFAAAKTAIARGATRVCLGAAWRSIRDNRQFDQMVEMVEGVAKMGVEVCCTMGMLNASQVARLKEAGLYAYNHNLDTSPEFYPQIITTRRYEERLETLKIVQEAGVSVCCGGIIGMGEEVEDRVGLLHALASRAPHPDSVPINVLVPVAGTPLETQQSLSIWEVVRMVATARITMPKSMVRLSAGRFGRSIEEQALCFLAGANSIFFGEKLLTCQNPHLHTDLEMLSILGLKISQGETRT